VGTIEVKGDQNVALSIWWDAKNTGKDALVSGLRVTLNRVEGQLFTNNSVKMLIADTISGDLQSGMNGFPDPVYGIQTLNSTINGGTSVAGNPFAGGQAPGLRLVLVGKNLEQIQKGNIFLNQPFVHWSLVVELIDANEVVVAKSKIDAPFLVHYTAAPASYLSADANTPVVDILIPAAAMADMARGGRTVRSVTR
jgi:hypothetical protein